jgi:hypothetical protein
VSERPRILCAVDASRTLAKISPEALDHAVSLLRVEATTAQAFESFDIAAGLRAIADALEMTKGAHGYEPKMVGIPEPVAAPTRPMVPHATTEARCLQLVKRNLVTEEARRFWAHAEKNAEDVAKWPEWKKCGIAIAVPETCSEGGASDPPEAMHPRQPSPQSLACRHLLALAESTIDGVEHRSRMYATNPETLEFTMLRAIETRQAILRPMATEANPDEVMDAYRRFLPSLIGHDYSGYLFSILREHDMLDQHPRLLGDMQRWIAREYPPEVTE